MPDIYVPIEKNADYEQVSVAFDFATAIVSDEWL